MSLSIQRFRDLVLFEEGIRQRHRQVMRRVLIVKMLCLKLFICFNCYILNFFAFHRNRNITSNVLLCMLGVCAIVYEFLCGRMFYEDLLYEDQIINQLKVFNMSFDFLRGSLEFSGDIKWKKTFTMYREELKKRLSKKGRNRSCTRLNPVY